MTAPAQVQAMPSTGLMRSAALMRALGAKANRVWAGLSPSEAEHLSAAMAQLPDDPALESAATSHFIRDVSKQPAAHHLSDSKPAATVWADLSNLDATALIAAIGEESPQVLAVILSRLQPAAAATAVRALPQSLATEALQRLLHLGAVQPSALRAIEAALQMNLNRQTTGGTSTKGGHERVARIFDNLDSRAEQSLLASLETAEPGAGEHIRALMFTFDDLASLGPASLQTLLAATERSTLILALKGAKPQTADAFFANMTQRAGDLLRSEIEAAGPVKRSDVESARIEIVTLARTLVSRGDLLSDDEADDELVE